MLDVMDLKGFLSFIFGVDVDIGAALQVCQAVAASEGVGVDFLHPAAADHLLQRLAVEECKWDNLTIAVGQRDAFHSATGKGILPHTLERRRQLYVLQVVAAVEDETSNFGHRVWYADRTYFAVALEEVVEEYGHRLAPMHWRHDDIGFVALIVYGAETVGFFYVFEQEFLHIAIWLYHSISD